MLSLLSADLFLKKKIHRTLRIQVRTNILLVLIWVQTVCRGYQQTTRVAASKERVKGGLYKDKEIQKNLEPQW